MDRQASILGLSQTLTDSGTTALESIQCRVHWLATSMIQHANTVRKTASGVKVGGHQASSASVVSIMTALYFTNLRAADRVSVKPHAAPVLHAINYLLGRLDGRYLTQLRAFGGLQSYPSRTKDPDPVDFSTGSEGIGATATTWGALAHRYVATHFGVPPGARYVALLGDAELDEGAIWECAIDPMVSKLGEVMWIVDLNRQSLDRVVPDIRADLLRSLFDAAGWSTVTLKYGRRLREIFAAPGGEALRRRIDEMPNEEYQHLLRMPLPDCREGLIGSGAARSDLARVLAGLGDEDVASAVRDLGGHDLADLTAAFASTSTGDRPKVIFAYTIKGWRLPIEGHPANHSALLTQEQWLRLAEALGADAADPWRGFDDGTPEAELCRAAAARLVRPPALSTATSAPPVEFDRKHAGRISTQDAFGRFFLDLANQAPETAKRVVTTSPDVASSTSLGSWINRMGIWNVSDRTDWFADDERLVRWIETRKGQHIELGISEVNMVGLLGELGLTWDRHGEPLLPIGTLYDIFLGRALEPWAFGQYAGGQSILVGTPSGVTLAPEGGAHHSVITPSIGLEQPRCIAWEPAFGKDLEWILLYALSLVARPGGTSSYIRLSTLPIDQSLNPLPVDPKERESRRQLVLAGGYRLRTAEIPPQVVLASTGPLLPETLAAADELAKEIAVDVICITSADLLFRAWRAQQGFGTAERGILDALFPPDRKAPIVSVLDGHPHTLAFLGSLRGTPMTCLGVDDFGQSGDVPDLYRHFQIDTEAIVGAALDLVA